MKYALVTGGSRGIGKAICLELAREGFYVIVNYHTNTEAAEDTLKTLKAEGGKGELLSFDVSSSEEIESALEKWQSEHTDIYISVLVNNAGITNDSLMIFMQDHQWHNVVDTSLNAFFYITRRLLKDMLTNRYGRIINIASVSGLKGTPGQVNYSAAKGGLIAASKSLSQEVAQRKVTVNVVAPGFISTDMTKDIDEKQFKDIIPMKRFGKPEEVASLVGYLASSKSSYITGEVISVNGGIYS
ncbi:3-oxoacyl-ACP reductase FabG [Marinilabiliaceae bacterium JC040]|nr:3-oxoacyl-ACP reductase FabG [Marinilabiliaceae bacterium JC040]